MSEKQELRIALIYSSDVEFIGPHDAFFVIEVTIKTPFHKGGGIPWANLHVAGQWILIKGRALVVGVSIFMPHTNGVSHFV